MSFGGAGPTNGQGARRVKTDEDASDLELVARIARRDEGAFRAVVERHGSAVFGVALRLLKDRAIAEDVAQETFVALWIKPERVKPSKGNLQSFLRGVARFKAIDSIRQEEARRSRQTVVTVDQRIDDFSSAAVDRLYNRQRVEAALGKLSQAQRDMIVATYFDGNTCRQAAESLGIPLGTAKTRLRDALIRLRRALGTP